MAVPSLPPVLRKWRSSCLRFEFRYFENRNIDTVLVGNASHWIAESYSNIVQYFLRLLLSKNVFRARRITASVINVASLVKYISNAFVSTVYTSRKPPLLILRVSCIASVVDQNPLCIFWKVNSFRRERVASDCKIIFEYRISRDRYYLKVFLARAELPRVV